jgi:NADH dehydrogenase/NADH:ubiquinone oxidoreductase subunit G
MNKISIYINDSPVITSKGKTILDSALEHNIYIPHLCYHPELKTGGSCRLCMVEIDMVKRVCLPDWCI